MKKFLFLAMFVLALALSTKTSMAQNYDDSYDASGISYDAGLGLEQVKAFNILVGSDAQVKQEAAINDWLKGLKGKYVISDKKTFPKEGALITIVYFYVDVKDLAPGPVLKPVPAQPAPKK